jgi:hypothetical protein
MKKYSIDILVYVDSVKRFFEDNKEAKEYFLSNIDENIFFEELCNICEKNINERELPNLTVEQFEQLRNKMLKSPIILVPGFEGYSLN